MLLAKGPFFRMMEYGDAGLLGLCLCLLLPATFDTLATLLLCFGGRIAGSSVSRADLSLEAREVVWADYALDLSSCLHVWRRLSFSSVGEEIGRAIVRCNAAILAP